MKTGMELVKGWRKKFKRYHCGYECCHDECADQLEAWLREADVALDRAERNKGVVLLAWVRIKLLGTTQSSGGSREGEK